MYSRNITLPNTRVNTRAIPNNRRPQEAAERIPVKSFVDSSAYEHFGTIGRESSHATAKAIEITEKKFPEPIADKEPDTVEGESDSVIDLQENDIPTNGKSASETIRNRESIGITEYIKPTISTLLNGLDAEIIILTAIAALIYFGKGSEGNTLAPIALIAIAFL